MPLRNNKPPLTGADLSPAPLLAPRPALAIVPFGVNEVRLNARQWLATLALVALAVLLTPWLWARVERLQTGPDYRIPYFLSADYWLYGRRLRQVPAPDKVILLGDSVVWGEYVAPDGTLSHFLNEQAGAPDRAKAVAAAPDRVATTARCQSLDAQRANWGGAAKVLAGLSGGSGIASIPLDDQRPAERRLKVGFEVGSVVLAAGAAGAFFVAEAKGESWARECSAP